MWYYGSNTFRNVIKTLQTETLLKYQFDVQVAKSDSKIQHFQKQKLWYIIFKNVVTAFTITVYGGIYIVLCKCLILIYQLSYDFIDKPRISKKIWIYHYYQNTF